MPSTDGQMSSGMGGGAVRGSPYGSQRGASSQFSQVRAAAETCSSVLHKPAYWSVSWTG